MKQFNLIFTQDSKIFLSSKKFKSWLEIQDAYQDYVTSIDFDNLHDIVAYLVVEFGISVEQSSALVNQIKGFDEKTIWLDF